MAVTSSSVAITSSRSWIRVETVTSRFAASRRNTSTSFFGSELSGQRAQNTRRPVAHGQGGIARPHQQPFLGGAGRPHRQALAYVYFEEYAAQAAKLLTPRSAHRRQHRQAIATVQ
jgi:hypothetical protein